MSLLHRNKTTIAADEVTVVVFDTADRCDRCNAQAHSMVKTEPPLYFCAHHRIRYNESLMSSPFEIVDDEEVMKRLRNE